jgi:hypothetical protein
MTDTATTPSHGTSHFVTQQDEMSLADEQSAQTRESDPDTLEVRDDSLAIMQGTLGDLRGAALVAVAVAGVGILLAVAIGAIAGRGKQASA